MKLPLPTENFKAATTLGHIDLLRHLAPPQAIIHIGAGTGNGDMHRWRQWQVPCALILDADEIRLDWAAGLSAEHPDWQVRCAVLAETEKETDYYSATNPAEDGLIPPEKLATLWPNLRASKQSQRQTLRLDNLLSDNTLIALQQSSSIWALIDCFPTLPILRGAGKELDRWSVLWLRVLLKPLVEDQTIGTFEEIEAILSPYSYRCVNVTEGNHPAIGEALFVRDWQAVLTPKIEQLNKEKSALVSDKSTLERSLSQQKVLGSNLENEFLTLTQVRDELTKLAAERQARIETLMLERDSHATQAAEWQTQIEALKQTNAALTQEIDALTQARDEQTKLAAERQSCIEAFALERDSLATQAAERQTRIEALTRELTALTQARDEQTKLATERQSRIESLTQERDCQSAQVYDQQLQIEALTQADAALNQEKSALTEHLNALAIEITALTQERDNQLMLATDRQTQLESLRQANTSLTQEKTALSQARDEQVNLAAERQNQIETLTQTNAKLAQEQTTLAQARDEQTGIAKQHKNEAEQLQTRLQQTQERIAKLESEYAESDARQRMLNEEMLKVEAQIELIKDILLREPGL